MRFLHNQNIIESFTSLHSTNECELFSANREWLNLNYCNLTLIFHGHSSGRTGRPRDLGFPRRVAWNEASRRRHWAPCLWLLAAPSEAVKLCSTPSNLKRKSLFLTMLRCWFLFFSVGWDTVFQSVLCSRIIPWEIAFILYKRITFSNTLKSLLTLVSFILGTNLQFSLHPMWQECLGQSEESTWKQRVQIQTLTDKIILFLSLSH